MKMLGMLVLSLMGVNHTKVLVSHSYRGFRMKCHYF